MDHLTAIPANSADLHRRAQEAQLIEGELAQRRVKVAGPPGTGKTTWIIRTINDLISQGLTIDGVHIPLEPEELMVVSFTRAAATEVRTRLGPLGERVVVGTLHSLAIRLLALGGYRIQMARTGRALKAWNNGPESEGATEGGMSPWVTRDEFGPLTTAADEPEWQLSSQGAEAGESGTRLPGDERMARIDRVRGSFTDPDEQRLALEREHLVALGADPRLLMKQISPEEAMASIRPESRHEALARALQETEEDLRLWTAWNRFKVASGAVDMADLIELALLHTEGLSGARVIIVDEAQDCSNTELHLLQTWETYAVQGIYVGDDDQTIYQGLKGNDPRRFAHMEAATKTYLDVSWRVPRDLLRISQLLIKTHVPETDRWDKPVRAARAGGELTGSPARWRQPEALLPLLKEYACPGTHPPEQTGGGQLMILAYAKHQLEPVLKMMREAGIPFHNPGSSNGAWNPLPDVESATRLGLRGRLRALKRLGADISRWEAKDLDAVLALLKATALQPKTSLSAVRRELGSDEDTGLIHDDPFGTAQPPVADSGHLPMWLSAFGEPESLVYCTESESAQLTSSGQGRPAEHEPPRERPGPRQPVPQAVLDGLLPDTITALQTADLNYIALHVQRKHQNAAWHYAMSLWRSGALFDPPRITPSTIHSAKGKEADHVILFPDLPDARPEVDPEVARLYYVAMSRPLHRLTVTQDAQGIPGGVFRDVLRKSMLEARAANDE